MDHPRFYKVLLDLLFSFLVLVFYLFLLNAKYIHTYIGSNLTICRKTNLNVIGSRRVGDLSKQNPWKVSEKPYHGWTQALWVKMGRQKNSGGLNGYASTNSYVIVTEGLSVLALFRLLITADYAVSSRNYN